MIITDIYKTVNYGDVEILAYTNSRKVSVRFLNTGSVADFAADKIKSGKIRDRSKPTVHGAGFLGDSKSRRDGSLKPAYQAWYNMIARCYSNEGRGSYHTYEKCTVCDEWLSFEEFEGWYDANYIDGFALDKDILIDGNTVYSPDSCIFVSHKDNTIKATAKSYKFNSPCGVIVTVHNLLEFCSENRLEYTGMVHLSRGRFKSSQGWTKAE